MAYDLKDLEPIILLMNQQEERLCDKINDVHNDVKRINGSIASAHKEIADIKANCAIRLATTEPSFEQIKNSKWILDRLTEMTTHPKTTVVTIVLFIIGVQTLVLEAISHKWLGEVWNYIRLIF